MLIELTIKLAYSIMMDLKLNILNKASEHCRDLTADGHSMEQELGKERAKVESAVCRRAPIGRRAKRLPVHQRRQCLVGARRQWVGLGIERGAQDKNVLCNGFGLWTIIHIEGPDRMNGPGRADQLDRRGKGKGDIGRDFNGRNDNKDANSANASNENVIRKEVSLCIFPCGKKKKKVFL